MTSYMTFKMSPRKYFPHNGVMSLHSIFTYNYSCSVYRHLALPDHIKSAAQKCNVDAPLFYHKMFTYVN